MGHILNKTDTFIKHVPYSPTSYYMFLDIIHLIYNLLYVNEYNRKHTYTSYSYHPLLYMGDILLITDGDILLNPTFKWGGFSLQ